MQSNLLCIRRKMFSFLKQGALHWCFARCFLYLKESFIAPSIFVSIRGNRRLLPSSIGYLMQASNCKLLKPVLLIKIETEKFLQFFSFCHYFIDLCRFILASLKIIMYFILSNSSKTCVNSDKFMKKLAKILF